MSGWAIYTDLSGICKTDGASLTEEQAINRLIDTLEKERAVIADKMAEARSYKRRMIKRRLRP